MQHRVAFFILLIFLNFQIFPVCAADDGQPSGRNSEKFLSGIFSGKFTESFDTIRGEIYKTGKVNKHNMASLRTYYPMTKQYTPFSDEIKEQMINLSFTIKSDEDQKLVSKAVKDYNRLVDQHFANLEVLFLAATLSEEDVRLGDSNFLKKASEALYEAALASGDGLSLRTAIHVVTFGEEDVILRRYAHGKLIKSDLYERDNSFINIHQFKDKKTDGITKLFFNISAPVTSAANKQKEEEEERKSRLRKF